MGVSPAGASLLPARLFRMPIVTGHSNRIRILPGNTKHSENRRRHYVPPGAPGPLPILGVGAGLAWSRRLRRRIAARP